MSLPEGINRSHIGGRSCYTHNIFTPVSRQVQCTLPLLTPDYNSAMVGLRRSAADYVLFVGVQHVYQISHGRLVQNLDVKDVRKQSQCSCNTTQGYDWDGIIWSLRTVGYLRGPAGQVSE